MGDIGPADDGELGTTDAPKIWLALDEVVDPQNFGAIVRSCYFFGPKIGILVCSKNSAPPSPVVSAASAGALELANIYSTSNLPRSLNKAKKNGWRVIGAAAEMPAGASGGGGYDEDGEWDNVEAKFVQDLREFDAGVPTIIVLGSEGLGLRTLVAQKCDSFVKIVGDSNNNDDGDVGDGGEEEDNVGGVDSLNVGVSCGIILHHFAQKM